MSGDSEDDAGFWFRPPWETEIDQDLESTGSRPVRKPLVEPDYNHPLLTPLARAQDSVACLEAKVETASPAIVEGLRARLSYLEAAGGLSHAHVWIHPLDLALRECGAVTSYGAAVHGDRLANVMPATVAQYADLDHMVETGWIGLDTTTNRALNLARMWRWLAELRTWRPLADAETVGKTLKSLGFRLVEQDAIEDWLAGIYGREQGPDLIRAGRAAVDWMCQPGVRDRDPDGVFLGVCLWRDTNRKAPIPLPFWSAPESHHHRLGLKTGIGWMATFLECVAESAIVGLRELSRLQDAETKGRAIRFTKRSRLPDAVDAALRAPIVTTTSLASTLDVSAQAAWTLLRQLAAAGMVREATGRSSWRAYVLTD